MSDQSVRYTYNGVFNSYGEDAGLVYEKLVAAFIVGNETTIQKYSNDMKAVTTSLVAADHLVSRASLHAQQEIKDAASHPLTADGPDENDILGPPTVEKAKCPRCQALLYWDWGQDCYFARRTENDPIELAPTLFITVTVEAVSCPYCQKAIAYIVEDDDGQTVFNHPELKNIDWEHPSNEYCINAVELDIKPL